MTRCGAGVRAGGEGGDSVYAPAGRRRLEAFGRVRLYAGSALICPHTREGVESAPPAARRVLKGFGRVHLVHRGSPLWSVGSRTA